MSVLLAFLNVRSSPFQTPFLALIFDFTTNGRFDITVRILIVLNAAVRAMECYRQSEVFQSVFETLNIFFISMFTAGCALKVFAFRSHYFNDRFNVVHFFVVIASILSIVLEDSVATNSVSTALRRAVRVARMGRVLLIVKGAREILTLLHTFATSLPAFACLTCVKCCSF